MRSVITKLLRKNAWATVLLLTGGQTSISFAQVSSENISPAVSEEVCPQPQTVQGIRWPRQQTVPDLDAACWVSRQEMDSQTRNLTTRPYLIDVRTAVERRGDDLSGALQIPLREISTRHFLQREYIVLVGNGLDYVQLDRTCRQLRDSGFQQVQALWGGSAALGHNTGNTPVNGLTPKQWIASLNQGIKWQLLVSGDISVDEQGDMPLKPHSSIIRKERRNARAWAAGIQRIRQQAAHDQDAQRQAIVLVLSTPPDAAFVQSVATELGRFKTSAKNLLPVYVLEGGWTVYQDYVRQIQAIQTTARHALKVPCGRL